MARELSFYLGLVWLNRTTEMPWLPVWEDPSLSYGAPFVMRFLPTWSTWREESNFPTYHGGNNWGKVGDERVARAVFNGSGDGVRRCSGSKGFSGNGGVGGGSSSNRRIIAWVFDAVARWQRRGSVMAARVQAKSTRDMALPIGVFGPNHRRQKS
jgi:hypothetical protein